MNAVMDFSIRRIDSNPVRGPGPFRRRRREEEDAVFDLDGAPPAAPKDPAPAPEHHEDTPVSAPDEDEAGGRLDVTA